MVVDISIKTFRNSIKFHDPEITESLLLISHELSLLNVNDSKIYTIRNARCFKTR